MEAVILDTNIVSFLMRGDSRAAAYRPHLESKTLAISFATIGELYEGAFRKQWSDKKLSALKQQIESYLVIPFSPLLCENWGRIRAERFQQPIAPDDAWIAAAAITHGCPLITNNPTDFANISRLQVISAPGA